MFTLKRKSTTLILIAAVLVALIGTRYGMQAAANRHFPEMLRGFAVTPKPIGQVSLVDKTGNALGQNNFEGKWTLVFFGYTNCPDVCPATLMQMEQLKKALGKTAESEQYQFLFVTVDPSRDTQTRLNEYVSYFDKDFNAAGGDIVAIKQFEHVFGAAHQYSKKNADDTHYVVAHSAEVYIVDPQARYVGKFQPPFDIDKLTHKLTALSEFIYPKGHNA